MGKGRAPPCCDSSQVKRGPWSDEESEKLRSFIEKYGHSNWRSLPKLAGLKRCGKSCRLRWINYLRPCLKRGNITIEEEDFIIQLHQAYGNKWSKIASHFPGRTDNEIKNVWNTHLKKRSSDINNHSVSSSSSSSSSSSASSSISSGFTNVIKCESLAKKEQFEEILGEHMACGFEVNALQSLECLFQDHHIPPPISKPNSLETHGESDLELWSQLDEPGLDDVNEWLNFLDNQTC